MPNLRILCRDRPQRSIALVTTEHALIFRYSSGASGDNANPLYNNDSTPRCLVEFSSLSSADLKGYRFLGGGYGTLGLIALDNDIFVSVVTGSSKAAVVRPGETVSRIDNVDFCMSSISLSDQRT